MHKGPKDAESHFKVTIVSDRFSSLGPVQRHRLVYSTLKSEFQAEGGTIHALSIIAKTPDEWSTAKNDPDIINARSPPCLGGEKRS